jgi:hypothetical protein
VKRKTAKIENIFAGDRDIFLKELCVTLEDEKFASAYN